MDSAKERVDRILKPFKQHGVIFNHTNNTQAYGDCPFTGAKDKFYVNQKTGLWDSKTAGLSGGLTKFLEEINKQNKKDMDPKMLSKLAINRGLPLSAFEDFEFGNSGEGYTLAIRNEKGDLADLKSYRLGGVLFGTANRSTYLFNSSLLVTSPTVHPVYLCEGEWDTIAMNWLLRKLNVKAVAVGVPGANTFKHEWAPLFKGRDVIICYDNDEAGEQGEVLVKDKLHGIANSVSYLHWPLKLPSGYDLRDFIIKFAIKEKKPNGAYTVIKDMLRAIPRKEANAGGSVADKVDIKKRVNQFEGKIVTFETVERTFRKWLKLEDVDAVRACFATILSTQMMGDPVWMFLVAAPGGCKTEIINSFNKCSNVYLTSSLTPHSLVSGSNMGGGDPSMLPKLHMKCLCIKDFTVIFNKKDNERDEIFSIFRDAYDGNTSKDFGNGIKREYHVHFSMLCGMTPVIYGMASQAGLGERFVKFYMGGSIDHPMEFDIIEKAIGNVSQEFEMREELADVVEAYMKVLMARITKPGFKHPTIPQEIKHKLINAVQYASNMRGTVMRDNRNNDIVTGRPFREVGTRFGKTLAKWMINLATTAFRDVVNEDDFRMAKKMILDTIDQRTEEVVRKIYAVTPHVDDSISSKEIATKTLYNSTTILRILNDMNMLKILRRVGTAQKWEWQVAPGIRKLLEGSGIYTLKSEVERVRLDYESFETRSNARKKKVILKRKAK